MHLFILSFARFQADFNTKQNFRSFSLLYFIGFYGNAWHISSINSIRIRSRIEPKSEQPTWWFVMKPLVSSEMFIALTLCTRPFLDCRSSWAIFIFCLHNITLSLRGGWHRYVACNLGKRLKAKSLKLRSHERFLSGVLWRRKNWESVQTSNVRPRRHCDAILTQKTWDAAKRTSSLVGCCINNGVTS